MSLMVLGAIEGFGETMAMIDILVVPATLLEE
jgi:hypothetical protein